jgi:hypothetical protein
MLDVANKVSVIRKVSVFNKEFILVKVVFKIKENVFQSYFSF